MCISEDGKCRPLGFLLGLLFAFLSLPLSQLVLICMCPCCLCVPIMVEFALALIKAPMLVMEWFISKIPC
ncbi:signaling peptide TAXIMIN 1-like [Neltuma alba]|uniref:signaling peptide TAXIMIN 1-like n=1 Tax=Neltuma alba TaxID=207710 RepID=UPI0010A4724D|nr:signaling peptide TAXIMIN 1-like [Prosopis alba]